MHPSAGWVFHSFLAEVRTNRCELWLLSDGLKSRRLLSGSHQKSNSVCFRPSWIHQREANSKKRSLRFWLDWICFLLLLLLLLGGGERLTPPLIRKEFDSWMNSLTVDQFSQILTLWVDVSVDFIQTLTSLKWTRLLQCYYNTTTMLLKRWFQTGICLLETDENQRPADCHRIFNW